MRLCQIEDSKEPHPERGRLLLVFALNDVHHFILLTKYSKLGIKQENPTNAKFKLSKFDKDGPSDTPTIIDSHYFFQSFIFIEV